MRGKKEIKKCEECLTEFEALSIKIRQNKAKYCSKKCYDNFRLKNKKDEKYMNKIHQKKNKYGINESEYLELMSKTNCEICNKNLESNNLKCIDHNHINGKIRGILCSNCNKALGLFLDNTASLYSAIKYLEKE